MFKFGCYSLCGRLTAKYLIFKLKKIFFSSDSLMEQRFMDQFQYITVPLQKFTKEISFISTSLMDLHKDIVRVFK